MASHRGDARNSACRSTVSGRSLGARARRMHTAHTAHTAPQTCCVVCVLCVPARAPAPLFTPRSWSERDGGHSGGRAYCLAPRREMVRFAFVGGADVPDWLLSQVFVVSRISAVKIKVVAKIVLQQARGEKADHERLSKLLDDGKLDEHEVKGVLAALFFILKSAVRYAVQEDVVSQELQQLGLPKEHSEALVGVLRDGRGSLLQHLQESSLRLPKLESLQWQVHEDTSDTRAHSVELRLGVRAQSHDGDTTVAPRTLAFRVASDMLTLLNAELKKASHLAQDVRAS